MGFRLRLRYAVTRGGGSQLVAAASYFGADVSAFPQKGFSPAPTPSTLKEGSADDAGAADLSEFVGGNML